MNSRPTLFNRMCAAMSGEISADTLEAYRRASLAVYDALEHSEAHRARARDDGKNAWTLEAATKAEILCTWNAFVLQTLGDRFLEADYEGDATTIGFVPAITSDQILRFYTQVEGWLNRAQQAHYNPNYHLDIYVPAELPPWSEIEPCPNAHLFGMLEAMRAVRDHTEAALIFLNDSPPQNDAQEKQRDRIRQQHASAMTKARYADDMMSGNPSREIHELVEEHVKDAIEKFYLLGQLLAMPELADKLQQTTPPAAPQPNKPPAQGMWAPPPYTPAYTPSPALFNGKIQQLPNPQDAGFDMWCLTDPTALQKFRSDREAVRALKNLWSLDPDPRRTLEVQAEINAAFGRGDIAYATDRYGKKLGHFFCAPWAPVYQVNRPVMIDNQRLRTMQQFIFNVTCEGVNLGAPFEREIMTGNFTPTTKFEYGDPNEAPDH